MPAFELIGLRKSFPRFDLGPLDLAVEPGCATGFIGPNGAGKTTTMYCMMGLLRPESGEARFDGVLNDLNRPEWKHGVGFVGDQQPFHDPWTGRVNLRFLSGFYPNWSQSLVDELANRLNLDLDQRVRELSAGNRVKLSLIAAMAYEPKLLLLDEPTAGLDPVVRTEVIDILRDLVSEGEKTVFYSTHVLSDLERLADHLVFLNEGRISLQSDTETLREKWRRFSFHQQGSVGEISAVVRQREERGAHELVSSDGDVTASHLAQSGVADVQVSPMSLNEIAIEVMTTNNAGQSVVETV